MASIDLIVLHCKEKSEYFLELVAKRRAEGVAPYPYYEGVRADMESAPTCACTRMMLLYS